MAITSDEVNFLVYRYLQECGFMHSAFTFAYESQLAKSSVISTDLPPGALISFVQKGLQYVGIEAHINEDGTERECEGQVSLLDPHICRVAQAGNNGLMTKGLKSNKRKRKAAATSDGSSPTKTKLAPNATTAATTNSNAITNSVSNPASTTPSTNSMPMEDGVKDTNGLDKVVDANALLVLSGHEKEVYGCQWNPKANILASGSSDSTTRLWEIPSEIVACKGSVQPKVLNHGDGPSKEVTTLEWNHEGSLLASGTYNGKTRVWSADGEIQHSFQYHNGPVFAVRWNPSSSFLLSASFDKTVAIWDASKDSKRQQLQLHDDPILDASWKDDSTFATCSSDTTICIAQVGAGQADAVLRGHTDAINSVKWDPSGRLLASCSDDFTVKIWDPSMHSPTENNSTSSNHVTPSPVEEGDSVQDREASKRDKDKDRDDGSTTAAPSSADDVKVKNMIKSESSPRIMTSCRLNLTDHSKEVYTFRWSRTGCGTDLPNAPLTLASASFDGTVKVWDIETGKCTQSFEHTHPVYGVAYSPNGEYLASGTISGIVNVWSLKDGNLVKRYQVNGDIYEVNWNRQGDLLAACSSSGDVAVINHRL